MLCALFVLPAVLAVSLEPSAAIAQPSPGVAQQYRSLVLDYQEGRTTAATTSLAGLSELRAVIRDLAARKRLGASTVDDGFLRAAAMAHTELTVKLWQEQRKEEAAQHLEWARTLVDAAVARPDQAGSFRRRWYVATGLLMAQHVAPIDVRSYFRQAADLLTDDVALLTAAGWYSERLAFSSAEALSSTSMHISRLQAQRLRFRGEAEGYYEAALAADAGADEAALRLSRVELAAGRMSAARERLTKLMARESLSPPLAYVARLLLGSLYERERNRDEATRLYREAIDLAPPAQAARLALSEMLSAAGDSNAAAAVLEPVLEDSTERDDPWTDYLLGYLPFGTRLFDGLRAEVQR
jgi:hypothetical protein